MTDVTETKALPWEHGLDQGGNLIIPLTSGEWSLVVEPSGLLYLCCKVPCLKEDRTQTNVALIGDSTDIVGGFKDVAEMVNLLQTTGITAAKLN